MGQKELVDVAVGAGVALAALLPMVNPLASAPMFLSFSRDLDIAGRRRLARRTATNVAVILLLGLFAGRFILHFFGISLGALEIAGGLIVGYAGWQMLHADPGAAPDPGVAPKDPSFAPLAMPMLAGPGALGVVIGVSTRADDYRDYPSYGLGIMVTALVVYLVFAFGGQLIHRLGSGGLHAVNQIFGFLVIAIAAELVLHGAIVQGAVYHTYVK